MSGNDLNGGSGMTQQVNAAPFDFDEVEYQTSVRFLRIGSMPGHYAELNQLGDMVDFHVAFDVSNADYSTDTNLTQGQINFVKKIGAVWSDRVNGFVLAPSDVARMFGGVNDFGARA